VDHCGLDVFGRNGVERNGYFYADERVCGSHID
jgi:hypothetical protein